MSDNLVVAWNKAALEAVRRTRMGPPIVARALHVLHAAMYDAWAAHDEVAFGTRLGDRWRRPPAGRTRAAKEEAASFAAQRALADLFPSEATAFAKLMSELGYDPDAVGPDGSPSAVGVQAARAVLAFRHGDEANQLGDLGPGRGQQAAPYADWTGYEPVISVTRVVDPNRWQPLATLDGLGQRFLVPTGGWSRRSPWRPAGNCGRPGRRAGLGDPAGPLVPARPAGLGKGRPRPGRRRQAVPRPVGGPAGRRHRLLGRQADLRLGAADHRHPLPVRRPGGARLGRPWAGHPADQGRGLAALHRHPAVPRVRLGALDLQLGRGRGAGPVHRVGPLRGGGDRRGRQLPGGAGRHAGGRRHPVVADLHRRRRPGRPLAALRRHPLPGGRP
jgi:hypothetical protein